MKTFGVVTCSKQKKTYSCPAKEMYSDSYLFRLLSKYCEKNYDEYVILSSKYGCIKPNKVIEPYENITFFMHYIYRTAKEPIKILSKEEQQKWAKNVFKQFMRKDYEVHLHINIYYWKYLKPIFDENNISYVFHKFERRLGPNIKKFKALVEEQPQ